MPCSLNAHIWSWGSSTTTDGMPAGLLCDCGLLRREDISPLERLAAENERLKAEVAALREDIRLMEDRPKWKTVGYDTK